MTRTFFLVAAALLPLAALGQTKATPAPAAASSTAQLESQLSTEICQDFEKLNAAKPFARLSQEEARSTLQQSMMQTAMRHPAEVEQLMQTGGADSQLAMQALGQRVGVKLMTDCPVALVLFTRLAGRPAETVATLDLTVTEAERPLLEKLAQGVCADLTAVTAKQPLAGQSVDQRLQLIQQAMQRVTKAHAKEISAQYGPEIFLDSERLQTMGAKVGKLTTSQCTALVAAFGTN
ncbi:hypothetical protein [Hymenobacter edaphi]|uniref:Uncharacterized protein n=1 Tax=Hymenobacter edaphi TaxID=2211146 RepID=A0A328BN81_9BACT|nr:hypothetical protein [Hymenobacter edaphi]RAK68039.1 hypothetical protein DLM85_08335 [Hymenobacter edaphi]